LIQTGDYADATQAANKAISDAGASEVDTVVLTDQWSSLTDRRRADLLTTMSLPPPADTETNAPLLDALGKALTGGTAADPANLAAKQAFEQQGLITVSGDLAQPCSFFVLVGGGRDESAGEGLDAGLIDALNTASGNQATLVGCEPSQAALSFIPIYQKAGIATVDCIDLPLGQLALPFALRGGTDKDDYGLKATAHRPLPASLEGAARA